MGKSRDPFETLRGLKKTVNVRIFTDELLHSLSSIESFARVTVQTEGLVVSGYAYTDNRNFFLRFYFNEVTGTIAFALIENQQ